MDVPPSHLDGDISLYAGQATALDFRAFMLDHCAKVQPLFGSFPSIVQGTITSNVFAYVQPSSAPDLSKAARLPELSNIIIQIKGKHTEHFL